MLVVHEMDDISADIKYATVSYPWIGVQCQSIIPGETFQVKQSGSKGDPLSIEVLRLVCIVCIQNGIEFLWVDRLCINQQDNKEKPWQLHRMHRIYQQCDLCVILPNGLQRIASLDEETPWITRMWTLQEAVLPPRALVLCLQPSRETPQKYDMLRQGAYLYHGSAEDTNIYVCPLRILIKMSLKRPFIGLFNPEDASLLNDVLEDRGSASTSRPSTERYQWYLAVWRSAMTRSSNKPEDLLLSTMGIFNISLGERDQRTPESIFRAFIMEFRKNGIADIRVVAFRDAIRSHRGFISSQWKELIELMDSHLPLLPDGIPPILNRLVLERAGNPPIVDVDGCLNFLGSALILEGGRHSQYPCRIAVRNPASFTCYICLDGEEKEHYGKWELQPIDEKRMEWVSAGDGNLPEGRKPVKGGYQTFRRSLWYAVATVNSREYIGRAIINSKVDKEEGGCYYTSDGNEYFTRGNYRILWVSISRICSILKLMFNP